jgi:hypothetical protein
MRIPSIIRPGDLDAVPFVSITEIANLSIDARLIHRTKLSHPASRTEYARAYPDPGAAHV